jgi:hypothetical protein
MEGCLLGRPSLLLPVHIAERGEKRPVLSQADELNRRRCSLHEAIQYLSERPMLAGVLDLAACPWMILDTIERISRAYL